MLPIILEQRVFLSVETFRYTKRTTMFFLTSICLLLSPFLLDSSHTSEEEIADLGKADSIYSPTLVSPSFQSPKPTIGKKEKKCVPMTPSLSKISWDIDMSPYAGGEDLLFLHRGIEKIDIYFLHKNPMPYSKTASARFWRLTELISVWLPLNYFAMLVQHEVFGHGYRIRDFQNHHLARVDSYSFDAPPPYGTGGGSTSFSISSHFTTTGTSAISSAGIEANSILALLTKLKWLESKRIDPRQAVLYLLSEQDITLYISSLKEKGVRGMDGHDITDYIRALNYTYPDHLLSKGRLRSLSWISLADPFTFYAVYSWFRYLSCGKETKIPMIASLYLPGLRLGLTPFGPQVFFDNFFLRGGTPLYAYLSGGNHADNTYVSMGVYAPKLWSVWKWFFGFRFDLWRQPKLLLQPGRVSIEDIDFHVKPSTSSPLYSYSERHTMRLGGAGSLIAEYRGSKVWGYEVELGYKSQGFLPGYSLYAFPTARLSFLLTF